MHKGVVYLVGAGPGDPELLTVKGLRLLQEADVILFDGLANPVLLSHAKAECEMVSVEKRPGFQRVQQDDINQLMVDRAKDGKCVVRLKGGDPFVFGRGGEEAEVCKRAGIPFEVVPGITSAIAAPAYAGIPATHRAISTHFTVVTGTTAALEGQHEVNWELLAEAGGTLLILMGTRNRGEIARRLMAGGRAPETPVTVVFRGTTPFQKTTRLQLQTLATTPIDNPSVIVVGPVAELDFSWFESRPLFGLTIAVTRARTQSSELVSQLTFLGAEVLEVPTIEIAPPDSLDALDQSIGSLGQTDWVVFTSTNAVSGFMSRIFELGHDLRVLANVKIATIGQATADAVQKYHLTVDLQPVKRVSEGLVEAFCELGDLNGVKILIPGAQESRRVLADGLSEAGAHVTEVSVYKTVQPKTLPERFRDVVADGTLDLITFTSSSTVENLVAMLDHPTVLQGVKVACIGPITAQTARDHGFDVTLQPKVENVSIADLVNEIRHFFSQDR